MGGKGIANSLLDISILFHSVVSYRYYAKLREEIPNTD